MIFVVRGLRFVVIDGNDLSLAARLEGSDEYREAQNLLQARIESSSVNAKTWNGGVSRQQLDWLRERLDLALQAGEQVIVFSHFPVFPDNEHNLWNAEELLDLLAEFDHVLAFMSGHNHAGHYGARHGVHFVTLEGMVETPAETAYAIVEVHSSRIVIDGEGRATDRELALPAP